MASFCLVHGAWHDDACWGPLVVELEQRGHTCHTPVLPLDDEGATFSDYADTVVAAIRGVEEPVVVGHSMASAVIPLVATMRPVALLVYLCPAMSGFPTRPDEPPRVRAGSEHPPHDGSSAWWPHDRAVTELYRRLPRALAEQHAANLRPQPLRVWQAPYPLQRPPAVPTAFVCARDDELFDERWSRWIASNVFGVEPNELPGGHFPMLEDPALLATTLDGLVRDAAREPAAVGAEHVSTALVGGTIIDGRGGDPVADGVVLIRGERIERVGHRADVAVPDGTTVIDTTGRYVLPGLIDVHVHYFGWMGELFLAHGVTSVKDVGNDVEWISTASDEVAHGLARGPRIYYTGNGLDTPPPRRDHFLGLEDPEMARRVVPLLRQKGAIAAKVREHVPIELLRPVVETAHGLDMKVTGHLRATDAREAALADIDGLEHASGIVQATLDPGVTLDLESLEIYAKYVAERKSYSLINEARASELVTLLVANGVALIPTMAGWWRMATPRRDDFAREDAPYATEPTLAYVPEEARSIWSTSALYRIDDPDDLSQLRLGYEKLKAILRQHNEEGGTLLAGSDTYLSVPGLSLQRELIFLVDVGFTPMHAITMATSANAMFMGQDADIGTVAPGRLADVIVLDGDPLADITNIMRVELVMKGGQLVDTSYHADFSVPTPRPTMRRPLWVERQLQAAGPGSVV